MKRTLCIDGTGWIKAACIRENWRDYFLINYYQKYEKPIYDFIHVLQELFQVRYICYRAQTCKYRV